MPNKPDVPTSVPYEPDPECLIGEPFALSFDCELDGTTASAVVRCSACSQPFRIMLAQEGYKPCPNKQCGREYTHVLLICEAQNPHAYAELYDLVCEANAGDDEQGDDEQGDDEQGDDDQGDDDQGEQQR